MGVACAEKREGSKVTEMSPREDKLTPRTSTSSADGKRASRLTTYERGATTVDNELHLLAEGFREKKNTAL